MQSSKTSPSKTLMRWTLDDYHQLVKSGILRDRRIELLQGELIEMAPESPIHTSKTASGAEYLRQKLSGLALIREAHPITLETSEPEPDLAVVKGSSHQDYADHHPYPEDIFLLVEIANSTLAYDLNEKQQTYAAANIPEYWVLDTVNKKLHVFRQPQSKAYKETLALDSGILTLVAFPAVQISVKAFLG
ncbi:MAG: Uma2 family endonuclease [Cyanobacteria bacterium J06627_28]